MVLVNGENTLLASRFLPLARNKYQICSFDSRKGNMLDKHFLARIFDEMKPVLCVNCEEIDDYEDAEIHRENAYRINAFTAGALAAQCKYHDIPFIHISTTMIYRQDEPAHYDEKSDIEILSVYTDSKYLAEKLIHESGCRHTIIRLTDLFGIHDRYIAEPFRQLSKGKRVELDRGSMIMPLYVDDAAHILLDLLEADCEGIYNLSGEHMVSRYDFLFRFLDMMAKETGNHQQPDVVEVDHERIVSLVDFPRHNCADSTRLRNTIDCTMTAVDDALHAVVQGYVHG